MSVALTGLNCLLYFTCWKMHFYIYYSANNGIVPEVLLMTDEPTPLQYTYCIIVVHKSDFHYVLSYRVNGSYIRVVRRSGCAVALLEYYSVVILGMPIYNVTVCFGDMSS